MTAPALFALAALLPAALGATPPRERPLVLPICSADGVVRIIELPLDIPGSEQAPCQSKGCHGGASRRSLTKVFEPAQ